MAESRKPPIWERLGFPTQNQYRNYLARQITNPDTGKPFTSYRQMRDQRRRAAGFPRDYALERERADIRARSQGFASARERQKVNRERRLALSVTQDEAFRKWGISAREFEKMRAANRKYSREYVGKATATNTYDLGIDRDKANFSDQRVGYIVSFYRANVDRKTNYWSLFDKKTGRRKERFGKPVTNRWQYLYLVQYGAIMSVNTYEARYGINFVTTTRTT